MGRMRSGVGETGPYLIAAARDPEFQLGLGRAAAAGRGAVDALRGETPRAALHLLATDSKLQSRIGSALQELDEALDRVGLEARPKRRRGRKLVLLLGVVLAAVGGAMLARRMMANEEPLEPIVPPGPDEG